MNQKRKGTTKRDEKSCKSKIEKKLHGREEKSRDQWKRKGGRKEMEKEKGRKWKEENRRKQKNI